MGEEIHLSTLFFWNFSWTLTNELLCHACHPRDEKRWKGRGEVFPLPPSLRVVLMQIIQLRTICSLLHNLWRRSLIFNHVNSILGVVWNTEGERLKSKSNRWVYEDWWPQGRDSHPPIWIPISTEWKLTSTYFVTIKKTTTVLWAGLANM